MRLFFIASLLALLTTLSWGQSNNLTIKGTVSDAATGEPLIGAIVYIDGNTKTGVTTGLDGSFSIKTDKKPSTINCSYIGYITIQIPYEGSPIDIKLKEDLTSLSEVVVVSSFNGSSETKAIEIERNSANIVSVLSSRAMELAPDITVGNIIQRMSGVTVERNSSGEGQYAILRGMDKRYNYTLVNGIKIPSPDNKNRFVPLDLFPSEILSRLEVNKSMTANLEGDGIGGSVNLIMKDAPAKRLLNANISTGYNALFLNRDFLSFDHKDIDTKSPDERKGNIGNNKVSETDFRMSNLHVDSDKPSPDITASLSYGDRIFDSRFGFLLSASYQNMHRGKDMTYYNYTKAAGDIEKRTYSDHKQRLALHSKCDFVASPSHSFSWYNGYLIMSDAQVRSGEAAPIAGIRLKYNKQQIFNSSLSAVHNLLDNIITADWNCAYSFAKNETPDNAQFYLQGNHIQTNKAATRRWEHNSDHDWSAYLNLKGQINDILSIKVGGMYRDKKRDSFFNEYTFSSTTGTKQYQVYGEDWENIDQLLLTPREYGNVGDPLNYEATEKIAAWYAMPTININKVEILCGLRAEHTDQGYTLKFARSTNGKGNQKYWDYLPDCHIKYHVTDNMNLHFSYARAINRPSFFEIVPYSIINEDYKEKGTPDLKHTVADNIDLRWEFFPQLADQIMVGIFHKHLQNPIEYGLINEGQDTYYTPLNLGTANNSGVEIDVRKYFKYFGVKMNYTFTHSRITTDKRSMSGNDIVTRKQDRPLCGQAAHVANLSLIYKDTSRGINAQITGSYIGKRLTDISNWYDNDIWENEYYRMELSAEKSFSNGIELYAKASNLLNLPLIRYINDGPHTSSVTDFPRYRGNILERKEKFGQTLLIGIRYKL
ncbi:MAG: TonB-dependent receptor [Bacteroidia bacterium]|nr:TonB-dependent receptor [Bacteroidia bacterium]